MLYPLRFKPIYKDYIWGGRSLASLGKILPPGQKVAESWEVSAHPGSSSIIANGPLAGISLPEACQCLGRSLLGTALPEEDLRHFPLLVKLIDAHDRLSVQVHPGQDYRPGGGKALTGKNEMWYIISAGPAARLLAGLKPQVDQATLTRALADGSSLELFESIPVQAGDVLNIPAGLVHAIGQDMLVYEVQQSSDITYRLFDYNRLDDQGQPRQLHTEQALAAINFSYKKPVLLEGLYIQQGQLSRRVLVLNRHFLVEELVLAGQAALQCDGKRFCIMTAIKGSGSISYRNNMGNLVSDPLFAGDTILIPASLKNWELAGQMSLLCSRPPVLAEDAAWLSQHLPAGLDLAGAASQGLIGLEPWPDTSLAPPLV